LYLTDDTHAANAANRREMIIAATLAASEYDYIVGIGSSIKREWMNKPMVIINPQYDDVNTVNNENAS